MADKYKNTELTDDIEARDKVILCVNYWFDNYREYKLDQFEEETCAEYADQALHIPQWRSLSNFHKAIASAMMTSLRYE